MHEAFNTPGTKQLQKEIYSFSFYAPLKGVMAAEI